VGGHASVTTTQLYVEWFGPKGEHADIVDAAFEEPAERDEPGEPTTGEQLSELQRQVGEQSEKLEQLTRALARVDA
jgi:hypothetical protein